MVTRSPAQRRIPIIRTTIRNKVVVIIAATVQQTTVH